MQGVKKLIRGRALSVYAGGVVLSLWAPIACGDGDSSSPPTAGSNAGGDAGEAGEGPSGGKGGTGGHGGSGGSAPVVCPQIVFINPTDGAKLAEADDVAG